MSHPFWPAIPHPHELTKKAEAEAADLIQAVRIKAQNHAQRVSSQRGEALRMISEKEESAAETRETINQNLERVGFRNREDEAVDSETASQVAESVGAAPGGVDEEDFSDDENNDTETDDTQDTDDPGQNPDYGNDIEDGADEIDQDNFEDENDDEQANTVGQFPAGTEAGPKRDGALAYLKQIRADTIKDILREWWQSNGAYDATLLAGFTTAIGAGQISSAIIEKAYDRTFGAKPKAKVGPEITERPGVSKWDEYKRPFREVEYALAQKIPHERAMERGAKRLVDLATTDLQLAKTKTARESMLTGTRQRYIRVIGSDHPCPLCLLASTQVYYREDLMPIHPNCECDVEPLEDGADPRSKIWIPRSYLVGEKSHVDEDTGDIIRPKAPRGSTGSAQRASDIRRYLQSIADQYGQVYEDQPDDEPVKDLDQLIAVRHHGEIGPMLTWADQSFRGPSDLPEKPSTELAPQVTNKPINLPPKGMAAKALQAALPSANTVANTAAALKARAQQHIQDVQDQQQKVGAS